MADGDRLGAVCPARGDSGFTHSGRDGTINVTIVGGFRTVVGICHYCEETIVAQEPEYFTQLAPVYSHHHRLPVGMWKCGRTGIDHSPANDGEQVVCVDCDAKLSLYYFRDNLTGQEHRLYLNVMIIEEEPV